MTSIAPSARQVYHDIMSRHPLAERDEVLEYVCSPLADPLLGRMDGTAWVRRILERAGIAVDENQADAFIKRAHMDLDPSDDEIDVQEEWAAELEAAGVQDGNPELPTARVDKDNLKISLIEAIDQHLASLTPEQRAIENATGLAEREFWGPGPIAETALALETYMASAPLEKCDHAGADFLGLVLEEGFALQMDRYILALLVWSQGGQRPHGYGDDGTGPGRPPRPSSPRPRPWMPGNAPRMIVTA